LIALVVAACLAVAGPAGAAAAAPVRLVWHVETGVGETLDSREADEPFNPASVVKVATTLWALERLGAEYRFKTRFRARGSLDAETGTLAGDLLVEGGGDPDFHVENGWLVARALNAAGVSAVRGRLVTDDAFWLGWEGGSEGRATDAALRRTTMASRLAGVLDPARRDRRTRRLIDAFLARSGIEGEPRLTVGGGDLDGVEGAPAHPLLVHRSNPLRMLLKRFNAYSNNDIERLEEVLGPPEALAGHLRERWGAAGEGLQLASLSGLGSNRMTPRQVVRLLRDLRDACHRFGLTLADLLPSAGCDEGTLESFPGLAGLPPGALVAKTGTLVRTDGGVAVLAGLVHTAQGERFFCVAAPGAGRRLVEARADEGRWLLDLVARHGGAGAGSCGAPVGHSTDAVELLPPPPVEHRGGV
jgi:D-alanyl-D-alanine carboxypeptidase/D-alanyl-D-alanine-endopeptidase (penicillin-binding protein 4)